MVKLCSSTSGQHFAIRTLFKICSPPKQTKNALPLLLLAVPRPLLRAYYFLEDTMLRPPITRVADRAFSIVGPGREPSGLFAQRGEAPELHISGAQVLVTFMITFFLSALLIWTFVEFAYSVP